MLKLSVSPTQADIGDTVKFTFELSGAPPSAQGIKLTFLMEQTGQWVELSSIVVDVDENGNYSLSHEYVVPSVAYGQYRFKVRGEYLGETMDSNIVTLTIAKTMPLAFDWKLLGIFGLLFLVLVLLWKRK